MLLGFQFQTIPVTRILLTHTALTQKEEHKLVEAFKCNGLVGHKKRKHRPDVIDSEV